MDRHFIVGRGSVAMTGSMITRMTTISSLLISISHYITISGMSQFSFLFGNLERAGPSMHIPLHKCYTVKAMYKGKIVIFCTLIVTETVWKSDLITQVSLYVKYKE